MAVLSILRQSGLGCGAYTFTFVALERLLATVFVVNYEVRQRRYLGYFFVFSVNVASLLYASLLTFGGSTDLLVMFCRDLHTVRLHCLSECGKCYRLCGTCSSSCGQIRASSASTNGTSCVFED